MCSFLIAISSCTLESKLSRNPAVISNRAGITDKSEDLYVHVYSEEKQTGGSELFTKLLYHGVRKYAIRRDDPEKK